jgi:hypothetical protein
MTLAVGLLGIPGATQAAPARQETELLSPDGAVRCKLFVHEGRPHHAVSFKNSPVIEPSPLVFSVDGADLTRDVTMVVSRPFEVKDSFP